MQYGVDEGMLYPLETLFSYMPSFSALIEEDPSILASITAPDGHVYGFPNLAGATQRSYMMRFFVNTEWLGQLNLEAPTNLDELYEVLCAFRDNDMNGNGDTTDEIPMCVSWNGDYKLRAYILNAFGFCTTNDNSALLYNADGSAEAVYIPYTSLYKDYLAYMKKLWDANLLDPDMFTQDQNQVNAKFTDNLSGYTSCAGLSAVSATLQYNWACAKPLVSEQNSLMISPKQASIATAGMFVINSNCEEEKAAAIANFVDSFFNPYTDILYKYGPTYSSEVIDGGEYGILSCDQHGQYFDAETKKSVYVYDESVYSSNWDYRTRLMSFWAYPGYSCNGNDKWYQLYAEKFPTTMIGMKWVAEQTGSVVSSDVMDASAVDNWIPYYTPMLPNFYYSTEDLATVNTLKVLLDDYVSNAEAKFITGELSLDTDWDTFVSELEAYGVKEYNDLLVKYWTEYNK